MGRRSRPSAAGLYHVAARAQADELLFRDEMDFLRFESELRAALAKEGCTCIAACAMTTHYHLLLDTAEGALSRCMKRLNQRYARAYNVRYGRRGHAFADRYLCVPVTTDEQLLTAYRYLVCNPVAAGLCTRPDEWPWSSYGSLTKPDGRFAFADASVVVAAAGSLETLQRFVESGV